MDENIKDYWNHLLLVHKKAQEDFDKTVLSLAGGAFGISFVFIKDVVGKDGPHNKAPLLLYSWTFLGVSMLCILTSYYFSIFSIRRALKQIANGEIYERTPGGFLSYITHVFNAGGLIFFVAGIGFLIGFVGYNFS